jgi:hypothetical protein
LAGKTEAISQQESQMMFLSGAALKSGAAVFSCAVTAVVIK